MAGLPLRARIRAGEALLALAAADAPDILARPRPDHSDPFVRRMSGLGYCMTLLVYGHRVVALDVRSD
ncbi:hypothetical protein [Nocardiopsis sp. CC223A]|uniref:hypothetical protein n=1 Tax=Nocardiopsis sp. CC223A TaxID=3044051 RepID=UPI00278C8D0A|nr:hypothetical protein [Nocardiopsis sp. CC223A]